MSKLVEIERKIKPMTKNIFTIFFIIIFILSILFWVYLPEWMYVSLIIDWLYDDWWLIILTLSILSLIALQLNNSLVSRILSRDWRTIISFVILVATINWIGPRIVDMQEAIKYKYMQIKTYRSEEEMSNRIQQTVKESIERSEKKAKLEIEERNWKCIELYWKWYNYHMNVNENLDIEKFCLNNDTMDKKTFKQT